jgi:hypothetical protein
LPAASRVLVSSLPDSPLFFQPSKHWVGFHSKAPLVADCSFWQGLFLLGQIFQQIMGPLFLVSTILRKPFILLAFPFAVTVLVEVLDREFSLIFIEDDTLSPSLAISTAIQHD